MDNTVLTSSLHSWKRADNVFRTKWNVHNIPALVRYESIAGETQETGRLVEDEILNASKLDTLLRREE